jgi:hypothetical protein
MGFWKSLFGKEEKVEPETPTVDTSDPSYCKEQCSLCGQVIAMKRYKKIQGKYFHKSCFKNEKKRLMASGMVH